MFKVGIIGCGNAAREHAKVFTSMNDRMKIVGCCDVDSIKLMDFKKRVAPNAEVFTDPSIMFDQLTLDVVLIATWPAAHAQQAMLAIEAGIPNVVIEKPLTMTAGEALSTFVSAQSRSIRIMESNAFMHHPRFRKIDAILQDKSMADTIHATFCKLDRELADPSEFDLDWRRRKIHGGGVPWEFASFMTTACNHFARDLPVGVYAYGSRGRYDTITRMHGMIEYLNGGIAFLHADKQSDAQELRLKFDGGTIEMTNDCWHCDSGDSEMKITTKSATTVKSFEYVDPFLTQWRDFANVMENGLDPTVPFVHSVVTMYVLDAMVTSTLQQINVELDIPEIIMDAYEKTIEGNS